MIKVDLTASRDLISNYTISWVLIGADIFVKAMNVAGRPWLFDSIITMMTISMRAKCNLEFGLYLKSILSTNVRSTGEKSSKFPATVSMKLIAATSPQSPTLPLENSINADVVGSGSLAPE